MKRLLEIQQELKAPKNQFNDFWKYKYRSCEDILTALKPLLKERNLVLLLDDDIISQWDRNYIQATAKLCDIENWKIIVSTNAFAREDEVLKWMNWSQITWSSSSYARKYALCWMFLIDDGIDADLLNKWNDKKEEVKEEKKEKAWFNDEQLNSFIEKWKAKECWTFEKWIAEIEKYYKISKEMRTKVKKLFDDLEIINS